MNVSPRFLFTFFSLVSTLLCSSANSQDGGAGGVLNPCPTFQNVSVNCYQADQQHAEAQVIAVTSENLSKEIILIHRARLAFYESVPNRLRRSIRSGLNRSCQKAAASADKWYCSDIDLSFVREVDVIGHRSKTAFVCDSDDVPDLKYLPVDEIDSDSVCIFVAYDTRSRRHFVSSEEI